MSAFLQSRALRIIGIVIAETIAAGIVLSFVSGGEPSAEPVSPPQPTTPMQTKPPDLPKTYLPGLGEFMLTVQAHHAKLWLAARAQNWPLAEYQLSEMKEVFSDVQDLVPVYRKIPVGQMIDAIATGPIADLEKAVEEKKFKNFSVAYGKLTAACNDCHKAASRGFIHIRRPSRSMFDNEEFRPERKR